MPDDFDDDVAGTALPADLADADIEDEAPATEVAPTEPPPAVAAPVAASPAEAVDEDLLAMLNQAGAAARPAPPPPRAMPEDDSDTSFEEFTATSGIQQQATVPRISKPWMKHHRFVQVKTPEEVERIVDEAIANGHCSLDLETEGFDNRIRYDEAGKPYTVHKIVGFCISIGEAKTGYYIPLRHRPEDGGDDLNVKPTERVEAAIRCLCQASQPTPKEGQPDPLSFKEFETPPKVVIDFWNAKFDQEFLYPITGIDWWHPESFEDGLLACFTLFSDDDHLGLKHKAKEKLRDPDGNPYEMIELKELFLRGRPIKFYLLAPDEMGTLNYACSDAVCTRLLCSHPSIIPTVKAKPELAFTYRLEKMVVQVIRVMERNRVKIDRARIKQMLDTNELKRAEWLAKIVAVAESKGFPGFEPASTKQLSDFLFSERGLNIEPKPEKNEKSGQYKTDADTLEALVKDNPNAPEVLQWVLDWRSCEKLQGTYLEGLYNNPDENDELRFDFKQTGAQTGRFSAPGREVEHGFSGIPIHGMPHTTEFRECFIARPGYTMVKSDYAGQELRVVANISGEPVWIKEFLNGSGDLHSITARAFFGKQEVTKEERAKGKQANFALVYGGGPAAIIRATGCDKPEAHRRKAAFDKAVPTFAKWVKGQHAKVKKDRGIWNPFGRWIAIPDANVKEGDITSRGKRVDANEANSIRAACERHSTNYPIQSAGADIMKIALVLLHREFHKRGWLKDGADVVRMLLTVHDEIVFEIKDEYVPEVLKVIVERMEAPTRIPQPPHSPVWKVPLVVEPLIGRSWGGVYDYAMLRKGQETPPKEGEKLKPHEIRVGNRIYHRIPPWLEAYWKPYYDAPAEPPKDPPPAAPTEAPAAPPAAAPPAPAAPAASPAQTAPESPAQPPKEATPKTLVFRIGVLTASSCRDTQLVLFEHRHLDPMTKGMPVRLLSKEGVVLVETTRGVRIQPTAYLDVIRKMQRLRLTDGKYDLL